jgi:hypothetical protein
VLMAAFPFALPLLILTAIAALPLVLLAIPVGLAMLVRKAGRGLPLNRGQGLVP